jgi:hypothetical protein
VSYLARVNQKQVWTFMALVNPEKEPNIIP